jgi:hypothetical protein
VGPTTRLLSLSYTLSIAANQATLTNLDKQCLGNYHNAASASNDSYMFRILKVMEQFICNHYTLLCITINTWIIQWYLDG